jgi:CheY-like chemotaxis protein
VAVGSAPTRPTPLPLGDSTRAAPPTHGKPTILVVEDDPAAAELLTRSLERGGYQVEVALDGRSAIEMARLLHPLAITLDVLLPELDGWEVLRALKTDARLRDIPVVIVSVVDDATTGYALGAVDYLVKPVDRDALLRRLDQLRDGKTARAPRVLVVEDDPSTLEVTSGFLRSGGFDVLPAAGGAEGIALARAQKPDIVLLDLMMPGLSGFDVAADLSRNPETRTIPILVLTAKELTMDDKRALSGQVSAVLSKVSPARVDLVGLLDRIVKVR